MKGDLKDAIRRIREESDLLDIVGRVVQLKRVSGRYWGNCPFHAEKTPSFCVRPEAHHFHCFGCGTGGDAITFVMKTENLSFIEAVRKLATELRIELPEMRGDMAGGGDEEEKRRAAIEAANRHALEFFRRALEERTNPLANAYLPQRGLSPELVARFQLGAAANEWSALTDHMRRNGYSDELLVDAGLSVRNENGNVYDRFRNRLIFPIFDHNNRIVGFGGRALESDDRTPKYLNSAENALYHKGRMLYALNVAGTGIRESGHAILCEGYMDVIMAHAHGFANAVGTLGTALTPDQARLLKRYTPRVHFLYDGDSAGRKAMLRGGEPLVAAALDTRVVVLPPEDDPDTFLRRDGADALRALIREAPEYIDFALAERAREFDVATLAGQAQLIEGLIPMLRSMKSDIMREAAITRLLGRVPGIPREAIQRMIARGDRAPASTADLPGMPPQQPAGKPGAPLLERGLLKLMLESPEALDIVRHRADDQCRWFTDEALLPWFTHFVHEEGAAAELLDQMRQTGSNPGDPAVISELLVWDTPTPSDARRATEELLLRLQEKHRLEVTAELLADISTVPGEDVGRLLTVFHRESRQRMEEIGNKLRTGRRRRGGAR